MNDHFDRSGSRRSHPAFTLIELLVVISIIALLISILLPALTGAREEGRKAVCMSNMRSIGIAVCQYLGNDDNDNLPWVYISGTRVGHPYQYTYWPGEGDEFPPTGGAITTYTWGGSISPRPYQVDRVQHHDHTVTPADVRPLNAYLDPGATGRATVKVVQCPGDRSADSRYFGDSSATKEESDRTSYEAYGNSYSINWYFMEEPDLTGWNTWDLYQHGRKAIWLNKGGRAAEWVIMWENQADPLFSTATLNGGGRLTTGWHRKFSKHTFLFLDGHVDYRYYDTRSVRGPGWHLYRKWTLFNEPPFS